MRRQWFATGNARLHVRRREINTVLEDQEGGDSVRGCSCRRRSVDVGQGHMENDPVISRIRLMPVLPPRHRVTVDLYISGVEHPTNPELCIEEIRSAVRIWMSGEEDCDGAPVTGAESSGIEVLLFPDLSEGVFRNANR